MPQENPPIAHPALARVDLAINDRIAILDTSFAMQAGFEAFLTTYRDHFSRCPLRVPTLVLQELDKHSTDPDPNKAGLARIAKQALQNSLHSGLAIEKHETCDRFADHVILRVVQQHMLDKKLLVLTNDTNLMKDLRQLKAVASVRYHGSVEILKLCPLTQQPKFFRVYKTSAGPHVNTDPGKLRNRPHRLRNSNNEDSGVPKTAPVRHSPFSTLSDPIATPIAVLPVHEPDPARAQLRTASGLSIQLDQRIAQGGEGVIYSLQNSPLICKLYFAEKLTNHRRDKIRLMVTRSIQHPHICWPLEEVVDENGQFRGFVMNKAEGVPLAKSLFIPAIFQQTHPHWTRKDSVKLAQGLIQTFHFLHRLNVIVGDINPGNILINRDPKHFCIVDCDSFQIEGFPCPVGTVNFTPPELQNQSYANFLRTTEHELYAVATLMFMILLPGKPPYSHRGGGEGAENIRRGEFPYTTDWRNSTCSAPQGCWMYAWSHLDQGVKQLFARTFDGRYSEKPRPTLFRWKNALENYFRELDQFGHVFPATAPEIGYDLSILPKNKRYRDGDELPRDGKTGLERLTYRMYAMQKNHTEPRRRSLQSGNFGTQVSHNPVATSVNARSMSPANQAGSGNHPGPSNLTTHEVFDDAATQQALAAIYSQRQSSALVSGVCLLVGCLVGIGFWGWWGSLLAVLGLPLLALACNRQLNEPQYYSLPGSRFANGDHRCIHCHRRGKGTSGIYIYRQPQESQRIHQCTGCRKPLFYS